MIEVVMVVGNVSLAHFFITNVTNVLLLRVLQVPGPMGEGALPRRGGRSWKRRRRGEQAQALVRTGTAFRTAHLQLLAAQRRRSVYYYLFFFGHRTIIR